MFDIITIGAATRDVFMVSDRFFKIKSKKIPNGVGECVALGSKIDVDELVLTTGGGATNTAATFASLGYHTATITRIGDDTTGKDIIEELNSFGVSTHFVRMIPKGQTAFSVLLTMEDGERTVLTFRGVSAAFEHADIYWEGCSQTKWIYLTSLGKNFLLAKKIIEYAKKAGVHIAWNPGNGELNAGWEKFQSILTSVDLLMLNFEEAKQLTKKRTLRAILKTLQSPQHIRIITDGTNGAYAVHQKMLYHAGTTGAKALSRTGAGDAFGSGFLAGLIKTEDVKKALAIGTLNAESVIKKHGAKRGILKKWPSLFTCKKIKIKETPMFTKRV